MTDHSFYAVGHGKKPGVYEKWADAQEQIKDFPQPVYKKFTTKEEAEEFVKARRPERVLLEVDEKADKFYAVARGKVVGIFTDYNEVKKYTADYPQPLYKKFEKLDDAKSYFKKYSSVADDGNLKESKVHITATSNSEREVKEAEKTEEKKESNVEATFYGVALGHKTGVFGTWEECQEATKDFRGAKFKKFDNEEEARLFVESNAVNDRDDRKRSYEYDDDATDGVEEKLARNETEED